MDEEREKDLEDANVSPELLDEAVFSEQALKDDIEGIEDEGVSVDELPI